MVEDDAGCKDFPMFLLGLDAHVDKDDGEKKPVMDEPADIMSKDELLQGMEKVDREIALVIQQINNFKKMQVRVNLFPCFVGTDSK